MVMKPSKISIDSPQPETHQFSLPASKSFTPSSITSNSSFPSSFYEPTSVLDPHLTSSPAAVAAAVAPFSDDWDPFSLFLSSENNFNSTFDSFELPELDYFPSLDSPTDPLPSTTTFDRTHLDLLFKAASSIECNDLQTAHLVLSRLNHLFPSSCLTNSPLQRAAFHFKDALLSIINPQIPSHPQSPLETVHRITAHKSFSDLSPIPQFTSFTANQILLESLLETNCTCLHLIDFDIGLGSQWSSFAQEVASRSRSLRSSPPQLRITAVIPEETVETALAAENLRDFANAIGIRLSVDFVRVGSLGTIALGGVRHNRNEAIGLVLTPTIFRLLGGVLQSSTELLRFVRSVSPRIVVFVDTETFADESRSFRRGFANGLEFYSAVLESIDSAASAAGSGGVEEAVRRIEKFVIRPRVLGMVAEWAPREMTWKEVIGGAGFAPVGFSEFTESQAEWLLRRAPVEGFHVARREGSMVLSWRGKQLAATSAWRC